MCKYFRNILFILFCVNFTFADVSLIRLNDVDENGVSSVTLNGFNLIDSDLHIDNTTAKAKIINLFVCNKSESSSESCMLFRDLFLNGIINVITNTPVCLVIFTNRNVSINCFSILNCRKFTINCLNQCINILAEGICGNVKCVELNCDCANIKGKINFSGKNNNLIIRANKIVISYKKTKFFDCNLHAFCDQLIKICE